MADLRIVDAPEIPTENITGEEKLPTGGSGNYSITLDSVADYTKTKKDLADNTSVDGKVDGVHQELNTHIEDLLNPHQVTKGQIGLGNVDNTADADKPVSNSTQAAIISAVAPKSDKTYVDNQLTLKANKADAYTKQESSDLVNSSISTALTPVNASLDLAKRGVVNRYDSALTYNSGERVVLANGDIVKSTVDGNTNDPNVDMTGWDFEEKIYYLRKTTLGFRADFISALLSVAAKKFSKIVVMPDTYLVDATIEYTLTTPINIEFSTGTVVNNTLGVTPFKLTLNGNYLQIDGNGAQFPANWATPTEANPALFDLTDWTLNKSCEISNIRTGDSGTTHYSVGIKGLGLNLPVFENNLIRAGIGFEMSSQDTSNTSTHAMGAQFRNNINYSTVGYKFINNGALSTEGWTVSGGEVISDTAFIVESGTFTGYSIVGRISDIHVNAVRFGSFVNINRIYCDQVDYQMRVRTDTNPSYKACFEFKGCQAINIDQIGISRVFEDGATVANQLSVYGLLNPDAGKVNAFLNIGEQTNWLSTASNPLIFVESASAQATNITLNRWNGGVYPSKIITTGYEQFVNLDVNAPIDSIFVNNGYCQSGSVSFNSGTGVLTITGRPMWGDFYLVNATVVPSNSVINSIESAPMQGKEFTLVFAASGIRFVHSASLLLFCSQTIQTQSTSVVRVKSVNFLNHRILHISQTLQDRCISTTSAVLSSISDPINTATKYLGKEIYNTTISKFMKATGAQSTSSWVSTDYATTITPT